MTFTCVKCGKELRDIPLFNGGNDAYPPSFLFCVNDKCDNHGLLTVAYKVKAKDDSIQPDHK